MKKYLLIIAGIFSSICYGQEYKTHSVFGLKSEFGTLTNPYTNGSLSDFNEKVAAIHMLEWGIEGMDRNFYINFKTDFLGIIPDYIFKAANKSNRKSIYGALMNEFNSAYNKVPQQYEFNASFTDFDVMGGHISYGYKYAFVGVNFAWSNTTINAYQSVNNIKVKKQEPANYYGFNERGNLTYGINMIGWNNSHTHPVRIICAYDIMLMRDYTEKWRSDLGNRISIDLQGKIPFKKNKETKKNKGTYLGIIYKSYDINYPLLVNAVEATKKFTASLYAVKIGYSW